MTTKDSAHKKISELVERFAEQFDSYEKAEAKRQTQISQLEGKIDYCESRINEIVYQLYELTPDEIKIIEGNG